MKICILINTFYPVIGGAQAVAENLASAFVAKGHTTFVVTRRVPGTQARNERNNVPIYRLAAPGGRVLASLIFRLSALSFLVRHRHQFDVIYANASDATGDIAAFVRGWLGKPVVLTVQNINRMTRLYRGRGGPQRLWFLVRYVDRWLPVGSHIVEELRALGCPDERIVQMPNTIDVERFRPVDPARRGSLRVELGLPDEGHLILFAGKFAPQKGIDTLLHAWAKIQPCPSAADWRLILLGDGKLRGEMETLADKLGLDKRVQFLGFRHESHRYMQAANMFIQPSRWEGVSLALLEALATELPVVSTDYDGVGDVLQHEKNGLIVPVGNAEALATALLRLMTDAQLRRQLGLAGRQVVLERFSVSAVADAHLALYQELVENARQPRLQT